MPENRQPVRLQKLLAAGGIASRRAAERLISDGHVTVNGVTVTELGATAIPDRDDVRVDGRRVRALATHTYLLLHKPPGYVTSLSDPHAEHTIAELLPPDAPRLYPVGRLDRDSEGALLLTDDGDLTERLLHPRYRIEREYAVLVRGQITPGAIDKMKEGIEVEGATVAAARAGKRGRPAHLPPEPPVPGAGWLRIVVREGRKREVRAMCKAVHLTVLRLIRMRFGPIELGDLPPGRTRPLNRAELRELNAAAGRAPTADRAVPPSLGRGGALPAAFRRARTSAPAPGTRAARRRSGADVR
jgi:23S rRNA pseudouridine2605 synthase